MHSSTRNHHILRQSAAIISIILSVGWILGSSSGRAEAQELTVGSPAPELRPAEWIKGEAWDDSARGQVRVVDFWSSWCDMCRATIAHVSKVAQRHRDSDVVFIGVSVWESEGSDVASFTRELGDRLGLSYRVALDQPRQGRRPEVETIAARWLRPAWRIGIPATFIIDRDGRIAWIGHPFELAEPLDRVVKGTWGQGDSSDIERAHDPQRTIGRLESKLQHALAAKNRGLVLAILEDMTALQPESGFDYGMREAEILASRFQDQQAMENLLDRLERLHPSRLIDIYKSKFFWETDFFFDGPKASAIALRLLPLMQGRRDEAGTLNRMAWRVVDPDDAPVRSFDMAAAQAIAERAVEASLRDPMILDTLALIRFERGDVIAARDLQREAVEQARKIPWGFDRRMAERLERFEAAARERERESRRP